MNKVENLLLLMKTVKNFWMVLAVFLGYRPISLLKLHLKNGMDIYIRPQTTDFHEVVSVLSGRDYPSILINRFMPKKPVVINIGAHIGCFDLYLKSLRPFAEIWSYEPNPNNYSLLRKNIEENHLQDIVLNDSAVGSVVGHCQFYLNESNPNESSMYADGEKRQIPCTNLPSLLKKMDGKVVDLLKMDCEGCEYEVLLQLPHRGRIKNVLMEYHELSADKNKSFILRQMTKLGYNLNFEQELFESRTGVLWFHLKES